MKTKTIFYVFFVSFYMTSGWAQDSLKNSKNLVLGYHIGIVQPLVSFQKGITTNLLDYDVYAIGFPVGISLATPGKAVIDLEIVPFVSPFLEFRENFGVHLLYHPGILYPLGNGFTMGFRLAFEAGIGQFGFTPLINKSFKINKEVNIFTEIVAPGRFGPNEKSSYTQVLALHVGISM